jgi:hypothetical protein
MRGPPARVALLVGARQQRARPLQRHIHAQWFAKTCQEKLNLVRLCDVGVAVGHHHKLFGKLVDGAVVT